MQKLKADFSPCHGVAQFGFIGDEGHDAQVSLDQERPLQYQHAIGSSRDGEVFMSFFHSLDELRLEILKLQRRTELHFYLSSYVYSKIWIAD